MELVGNKEELPIETATDLQILYSDSARIKAKVNAPLFERFVGTENYTEMKEGISVEFYDKDGTINSKLTADYATHKTDAKIIEARKNVVVVNIKGEKLNTEFLQWDERTGKIYSNEFVTITTPQNIIYGDGFESDQHFTNYRIFNTKGIISIDKE